MACDISKFMVLNVHCKNELKKHKSNIININKQNLGIFFSKFFENIQRGDPWKNYYYYFFFNPCVSIEYMYMLFRAYLEVKISVLHPLVLCVPQMWVCIQCNVHVDEKYGVYLIQHDYPPVIFTPLLILQSPLYMHRPAPHF